MYDEIKKKLKRAKNIVFFTGAGMSTESGIPDFRSKDGLYSEKEFNGYEPEFILSRSFFLEFPQMFYNYYFKKIIHEEAEPNIGHLAIAGMQKESLKITVVTQNIDGLHTEAGSEKVIELHGSVHRYYCTACGRKYSYAYIIGNGQNVPVCETCKNIIRPDVTLYEEPLEQDIYARSISRIAEADVLFAIGSSLTVQPAAGLLDYFNGDMFVIINRDSTDYDNRADYVINESCGIVLTELAGGLHERTS